MSDDKTEGLPALRQGGGVEDRADRGNPDRRAAIKESWVYISVCGVVHAYVSICVAACICLGLCLAIHMYVRVPVYVCVHMQSLQTVGSSLPTTCRLAVA